MTTLSLSLSLSLFVLVLGSCILRDLGKPRMDQQNEKPKLFCSELFVFGFYLFFSWSVFVTRLVNVVALSLYVYIII